MKPENEPGSAPEAPSDSAYDVLPPEPEPEVREEPAPPRRAETVHHEEDSSRAAARPPLVRSTRPEWMLAVGAAAFLLFAAAAFAAQRGLFPVPGPEEAAPDFAARILVFLRGAVLVLVGTGCMAAGAFFYSLVEERRLGDLRVLAARCFAVTALALLARLIPLDIRWLKQLLDVVAPLAAAFGLTMLLFRLAPREAGILLGGALVSLVIIAFGSAAVTFALAL